MDIQEGSETSLFLNEIQPSPKIYPSRRGRIHLTESCSRVSRWPPMAD